STKYQEIAVQKRTDVWSELLFWIEFRATRYFRPLKELSVIEIGERHEGFSERVKSSCQKHSAYRKAIDVCDFCDAVLYLGTIIGERSPTEALKAIHKHINKDGLLFLSSRVSTGFDILTLKGNIGSIYPYEVVTIPSIEALQSILKKTGFEVLEISTPGMLDMHYVVESRSKLESGDLFTKYLAEKTDKSARSEFQRLLQKNAMSSHAQFVARVCHE
ncbi:MAG: hypothetical protein FWG92_08230, partial [Leptospirales bacterium]|nr:hypothetical protein [Leptospirales bacterium]